MASVPDRVELPELPAATAVIDAVKSAGHEIRFAGGIVRDCLLGRPIGDADLATTAVPDLLIRALKSAGIRGVPTGIEHGTVTAVVEGVGSVEVTSLRRDVETDGRHAVVKFGADWAEDAKRRDFTFNALFADADGTIFDFVSGVPDAMAGRVRFVGSPDTRIQEDYLRILRFFRFQAVLGKMDPDEGLLIALARHADKLADLSSERVTKEVLGFMAADDPARSWKLAVACGIDRALFGQPGEPAILEDLIAKENSFSAKPDPMRRLSLLAPSAGGKLTLSTRHRGQLVAVRTVRHGLERDGVPDENAVRAGLYRHGRRVFFDALLTAWTVTPAWPEQAASRALNWAQTLEIPEFPVSGQDVMNLGITQGPVVGNVLDHVESWWIDGGLQADRDRCLDELDRYSTRIV